MRRYPLMIAVLLLPFAAVARTPSSNTLTLERIMANPDWISVPALNPYWSADGHKVYFEKQPHGSSVETLYVIDASGGDAHKVDLSDWSATGSNRAVYNRALTRQAWVAHGDLFVRNLQNGHITQITRGASVSDPMFMADGERIAYQQDERWFISDPAHGLTVAVANLKLADAPEAPPAEYDYVTADPLRLFDALKKKKADAEAERRHQQALARADASRAGVPWYLGDDIKVIGRSLSPNGRWLLLVTEPKHYDEGKQANMPDYINDDGRIVMHDVHYRVGMNPPAPNHVLLLDLKTHQQYSLDETTLPGIKDDPLAKLREQAIEWDVKHGVTRENAAASVKAPDVRPVQVYGIEWNDAGTQAAVEFVAIDNKDRWIATVDFNDHKLVTADRLHDPAWINWTHNAFGWLPDNDTLWFLSEKSGYSQLYLTTADGDDTRALTQGRFVVETPVVSHDGRYIYFQANPEQPGTWNVYRVATHGGDVEQITNLPGLNGTQPWLHGDSRFVLSPDDSRLLFYHSTTTQPPELFVKAVQSQATVTRLTHTITPEFQSIDWVAPKIVKIPSSHVDRPLYTRVYLPADYDPNKTYAGAVFIHGAGYLQDAHSGWSYYFHEMMFNNLLTREGYVVFDMDYRGSAGYGRDWRTAIYRNMGHPEVEDIADGVHWITQHYHVDPDKLGVYGGSYGGFMTYMMMFRKPNMFAAGAALRPVADWANYNRGYTSAILNTPNVDPIAYRRSSPIYYADQLKNPLLIEQGLLDDNVFFQDTVYMVQRLIELKKPFDVEFFPMEHHGFVTPEAWLHEYRKIHKLFSTYVNPTSGR